MLSHGILPVDRATQSSGGFAPVSLFFGSNSEKLFFVNYLIVVELSVDRFGFMVIISELV